MMIPASAVQALYKRHVLNFILHGVAKILEMPQLLFRLLPPPRFFTVLYNDGVFAFGLLLGIVCTPKNTFISVAQHLPG